MIRAAWRLARDLGADAPSVPAAKEGEPGRSARNAGAGGTEACGKAIFESKADPDYQKILGVFKPLQEMLEKTPRADMGG